MWFWGTSGWKCQHYSTPLKFFCLTFHCHKPLVFLSYLCHTQVLSLQNSSPPSCPLPSCHPPGCPQDPALPSLDFPGSSAAPASPFPGSQAAIPGNPPGWRQSSSPFPSWQVGKRAARGLWEGRGCYSCCKCVGKGLKGSSCLKNSSRVLHWWFTPALDLENT